MKSSRRHIAAFALLPLLVTFGTRGAIAQITPAADGTGTVVKTQNNQINISGGTQAGQNQFHSFQQFGVNAGQTANFMANPNIANILGRVTGGDASLINGILKVTGSNANLFLINPSGIVFGKDASLNLPAAFTATTANGIGFGNGNWWSAAGSNNYASLTANPTSFGFIGTSGSLVNAGNLSVNSGQSIALVGGTVVNTGTIAAPGGDITIAAIPGEKMVRIGQAGTVLSLDLPTSDRALINAPTTTPLSLPALLTGGSIPAAMGVVVEEGVIKLTGGSASVTGTLNANGTGAQNGGNVIAYADNQLTFGGTIAAKGGELGGNGGFVDTSGKGSITIAPNAQVLTTAANGLTGTWLIDPTDLTVVVSAGSGTITGGTNSPTAASSIDASTIVTALNGTNVNLQADNSITVNAGIDASANASAGNLTLTAPIANLNQAIVLKAGSTLSGTATTVNVGATGTVQNGVDVSAAGGIVNLAAATYTLAQEVGINKNVTVRGTGAGSTTVSGNNAVRVFNIGTTGTVTLDGMSIVNGKLTNYGYGGGINNSGTLTVSNSTLSGNSISYGGRGGGIYNNGMLTVNNSTLSGNSASFGYGGGIHNNGMLTVNNSTLSGNSASFGYGGGILNNRTLTVNNSTLSGNSASSGGGIHNSDTATLNNSTLSGNSATDNSSSSGGGIDNYGTVTLNSSTLSGNYAAGTYSSGGGISTGDIAFPAVKLTLIVNNSSISGNYATGTNSSGGGIFNDRSIIQVNNSTLSGNSTTGQGGGIYNSRGPMIISNSIVSGNTAGSGREIYHFDYGSRVASQGYNLFGYNGDNGLINVDIIGTDRTPTVALNQIIAPLANNGGPTQTHALVLNSPALNAGDPTSTLTIDQRGGQRGPAGLNAGSRIDIGAYEATSSILVTNTLDTSTIGTLRNAIAFSNGNTNTLATTAPTDIRFNIGTVGSAQTIALTSALPAIVKSTTIDGWTQGAAGYNGVPLITVSGENKVRVFEIGTGVTVGMNGLAIVNGKILSGNGGAGIYNRGTLTVTNSVVSGNSATQGGGIQNDGTLTLSNSTLSGNSSSSGLGGGLLNYKSAALSNVTISGNSAGGGSGGGIDNRATLTVSNSTISGNFAGQGGGINSPGAVTIGSTIISGNIAPNGREIYNSFGTFTSQGYNLFGYSGSSGLRSVTAAATDRTPTAFLSEILSPLGNYGGPTQTHALLPGSPAIDAGNAASNTLDQRGKVRFGTADIGAFESQGFTIAATGVTTQSNTVNRIFTTPLTATVTANNAIEPVAGGTVTYLAPSFGTTITAGIRTVTIDALGNANLTPTATTTAGTYTALAETAGATGTAIFNLTNTPDVPFSIAAIGGTSQSAVVNQPYAQTLQVTVFDQFGNLIPGATVGFSVPGSGASGFLGTTTATTGTDGRATIVIKANTKAGAFTAKGGVSGVTGTADFALTNLADVANKIITTSGSGQSTVVDTNFTNSLVATVTDKFDNPIENATVTFSATGTNASGTFATNTATTGADGKASIVIKANTKAGIFTAQGSTTNVTGTADFALTNLADVAKNIATTSGSNQQTTVDTNFANNLVATVTDKFGNPVSNSTVTFTVPGTGASGIFATNTAITDANGRASIVIKANTKAGLFTAQGGVSGVTGTADFALTNLADVAKNIATTSGSGQQTVVDTNFANNLVATVTDKFGNPVSNSTVTFTVPGTGASGIFATNTAITGTDGKATIVIKANTKAGIFTAKGSTTNVTGTADFALTNLADVAKNIATTSGSNQQTVVDTNFANSLVATVTDQFGNPVSNSTVTFTVPGTNASGIFATNTATTGVDGKASIAIKANTKAGTFTAQGSTTNVTGTADFALTNLADIAKTIVTTSGSGQSTVVDTNFTNNLVATVTDKFGNPVSNSTVTFTVPGTNASGIFASNTATTDGNGVATIAIKANTKAGSFTAIGNVTGIPQSADFALTNQADQPSQIIPTNANQTATVNQPFNTALQVQVLDQYGNPIANNPVKLTLPSNGASGVFTGGGNTIVLTTDSNGFVTTPLTANANAGTYTGTIQVNSQTAQFSFTNAPAPITPAQPPRKVNLRIPQFKSPVTRPIARPAAASKARLCADRDGNASAQSNDPYQGIATCGTNTPKSQTPELELMDELEAIVEEHRTKADR